MNCETKLHPTGQWFSEALQYFFNNLRLTFVIK